MKIITALIFTLLCSTAMASNVTQLFNKETQLTVDSSDGEDKMTFDMSVLTSIASRQVSDTEMQIIQRGSFTLSYLITLNSRASVAPLEPGAKMDVWTYLTKNGVPIPDSEYYTNRGNMPGDYTHDQMVTLDLAVNDIIELYIVYASTYPDNSRLYVIPGAALLTAELNYEEVANGLAPGAIDWNDCQVWESDYREDMDILSCNSDRTIVEVVCDPTLPICGFTRPNAIEVNKDASTNQRTATIKCCGVVQ